MFLPNYRAWVIAASLVICIGTWFVIERTRLGAYLRAATENPTLVQTFGINQTSPGSYHFTVPPGWYEGMVIAVTAAIVALSWQPARNLVSRVQLMNASFDPLHLVNTYGAFGGITRRRYEIVVEGTRDPVITDRTRWREYEFRGKPGDPRRWPRQFAPYHLRLDWLMWFAALSSRYADPWLPRFLQALLTNQRPVLALLRSNPFPDAPPTFVRARLYRYQYTSWPELRRTGAWWVRTFQREYAPPVALRSENRVI